MTLLRSAFGASASFLLLVKAHFTGRLFVLCVQTNGNRCLGGDPAKGEERTHKHKEINLMDFLDQIPSQEGEAA